MKRAMWAKAFYGCESLAVIELPDGIEMIDAEAFRESRVEDFTVPVSTRTIARLRNADI